jgi:hypothetical protein
LHEACPFFDGDFLYLYIAIVFLDEFLSRSGQGVEGDGFILTVVGRVHTADKKAEKEEGEQLFHDIVSD